MSKRILALILCAFMIVPLFASCGKKNADDKGPLITMYLSDDIYDFDPINAFYNKDTHAVVSMMFDTLFSLDENGKVQKSLAKKYSTDYDEEKGEYTMEITLRKTYWSNGALLTSDDVVYAWRRLLRCDATSTAAALLFDIKNARLIKEGGGESIYIDELGVEAINSSTLKITFEGKPDYDQFLLNLTSIATAPLLEGYVAKNADWAKKASTMVTSGPFKLGKINYAVVDGEVEEDMNGTESDGSPLLYEQEFDVMKVENFYLERNFYYRRNADKDAIDSQVTPHRLLVDCSKTDAELLQDYKDGKLFYMGSIPMSIRNDETVKAQAQVSDALSTLVCYINHETEINGEKPFADAAVRKALSLAINRQAIAEQVVFATAATALVPNGLFNTDRKTDFRTEGGAILPTGADANAKAALPAGFNPADYSFTIKVAANNDVHVLVAKEIEKAWGTNGLGFNVTVEEVNPIVNNDYFAEYNKIPTDNSDDLFIEDLQQNDFEVAIFDYVAYSADAYSMLANFAKPFSGSAVDTGTFDPNANASGYNNQAYNDLIEAAYLIPYFSTLNENSYSALSAYTDKAEEFKTVYNRVKAIYAECNITPTDDSDDWAKQRAILLHKAEALLLQDYAIIPVLFNKHAVLVSDQLNKTDSENYYTPVTFTKASVKDFEKYTYTETKKNEDGSDRLDAEGKPIMSYKTIFDSFPEIEWDKVSQ